MVKKERISRVNKNGTNEASNLREKGLLMSDSIDQTKPVPKKNEPLRFWMEVEAELRKNGNKKRRTTYPNHTQPAFHSKQQQTMRDLDRFRRAEKDRKKRGMNLEKKKNE